jgi:holin-like protein
MTVLQGLAWLLLCQSAGEALTRLAHLPLPGPVLGMLLLIALLQWPPVRSAIGTASDALLAHLSLLFVPVGVGVMTHLGLLSTYGLRLLIAITLSTWIGLAVTAGVLRLLLRPSEAPDAPDAPNRPAP